MDSLPSGMGMSQGRNIDFFEELLKKLLCCCGGRCARGAPIHIISSFEARAALGLISHLVSIVICYIKGRYCPPTLVLQV
jgi:hypothetical protein